MAMQRKKVLLLLIGSIIYPTVVFADASLVYQKHLQAGIEAFNKHYFREAERNFKEAHLIFPLEREPIQYLGLLKKRELVGKLIAARVRIMALEKKEHDFKGSTLQTKGNENSTEAPSIAKTDNTLVHNQPEIKEQSNVEKSKLEGATNKPAFQYHAPKDKKANAGVIHLDDIVKVAGEKASITIEWESSWHIEGKNIKKFLVVDENIIAVDYINLNRIRVKALRHGSTFLHIWDDIGRRTLMVTVILPPRITEQEAESTATTEHAQPLKFIYAADSYSFYSGKNIPNMERRNIGLIQQLGVEDETPYGVFDASGTMQRGDRVTHIPTYTIGLSNIPMAGTQDLDLRLFDSPRQLSPLTLPGAYLRGAFADVNILDDTLRLSLTHGKYQQAVSSYERGFSESQDVFVDAGKVVLFPDSPYRHYAFNYASSHGPNRQQNLSPYAYSIEGMQKINEVTLKGELARDEENYASTTCMSWKHGSLRSALNFRDINKDFTNVTSAPSNQGEIGSTWTTDWDLERIDVNTSVDIYQDTLYFNPNDPDALNYDMRAYVRNFVRDDTWIDSNASYVHTPGEISPHRNASLYERLSRHVKVWKGWNATVFIGGSYQRNRYANSEAAEFNRYSVTTGVQVPLIEGLAGFVNYEYSWVDEIFSKLRYNPNVLYTGLTYSKSLTTHINGNWGLSYRKESNVKGTNSFLTGEDSLSGSTGLTYNPTRDVSFFVDGRLRSVRPVEKDNPSYDDLDIRLGMRAVWGAPLHWDPSGIISGMVCLDQNGDGKCTALDRGLYGVKVKVGDKETTTDQSGNYHLEVFAKKVIISPVLTTLPPGSIFTGRSSVKVDISRSRIRSVDFGVKINSGIYGVAYVDKNGNHIPDSGDQFIGRVRLILDGKTAQFTDNQGVYIFNNITPGKHIIELDMKVLPEGFIPLIKLKNEVEVAEGTTYVLHFPLKVQMQTGGNGEDWH